MQVSALELAARVATQTGCPSPVSAFLLPSNPPPSFPRKRESNTSAWIPGLRFTAPGMTGERGGWYPFLTSVFPCAPQTRPPSFPRKRESNTSAWIPGLRCTAPGMTGQRGAGIRSLSAYSHARRTDPPSFPRKRESNTSAWIPGLRFIAPGMTGERGGWYPFLTSVFPCAPQTRPPSFPRKRESTIPRPGFRVSVSLRPE